MNRVQDYMNATNADDINFIKMNNVVNEAMDELTAEINLLTMEKIEAQNRIKEIDIKIAKLEMRYQVFDSYENRGAITTVNNTNINLAISMGRTSTPTSRSHSGKMDKMVLEDCVKEILNGAGIPMKMSSIISSLEKFGHRFATYASAHSSIIRKCGIEKAGVHGYYQLIRKTTNTIR